MHESLISHSSHDHLHNDINSFVRLPSVFSPKMLEIFSTFRGFRRLMMIILCVLCATKLSTCIYAYAPLSLPLSEERQQEKAPGISNDIGNKDRPCAFNFYGLPRAFKHVVLPSIETNVIIPNSRYDCDYFVFAWNVTHEDPSRSGSGGPVMPEDVFLLRDTVHMIARRAGRPQLPHVGFIIQSDADFEQNRSALLEAIRKEDTKRERNPYIWRRDGYTVGTNVKVMQAWHSISTVWELMKEYASSHAIKYKRVAMMRIDAMYITPIDIFGTAPEKYYDGFNNRSVVPGYAAYPVNDRLFYGPYEAAEIWAYGRFSRIDHYVHELRRPLHPERFLATEIFPAIRELNISIDEDPHLCFLRARADGSVWDDCPERLVENLVRELSTLNCSSETSFKWSRPKAEENVTRSLHLC